MASIMLKISIVLCLYLLLVLPCNGDSVVAWRLWKQSKTVCGYPVKDFPESLKTRIENHENTTAINLKTRRDQMVVTYDNFRCCMKKTWAKEMHFDIVQSDCIRKLLECFLAAEEKPCTLQRMDYILLIISDDGIIVLMSFTAMVVVITGFVLREIHRNYYNS